MSKVDAGAGFILAILAALMIPIVSIGFCAFIAGLLSGNHVSFIVGCIMFVGSLFFLAVFIKEYRDGPNDEEGTFGDSYVL